MASSAAASTAPPRMSHSCAASSRVVLAVAHLPVGQIPSAPALRAARPQTLCRTPIPSQIRQLQGDFADYIEKSQPATYAVTMDHTASDDCDGARPSRFEGGFEREGILASHHVARMAGMGQASDRRSRSRGGSRQADSRTAGPVVGDRWRRAGAKRSSPTPARRRPASCPP